MKRTLIAAVTVAFALAAAATASASPKVTVLIHHQLHGCHAWSVNGDAFGAKQVVHAARGTIVSITNDDVMAHTLVQQGGPRVAVADLRAPAGAAGLKGPAAVGLMGHMGSGTEFTLSKPGTYRFTTKEGNDYFKNVKTVGADNVLELTIVVS